MIRIGIIVMMTFICSLVFGQQEHLFQKYNKIETGYGSEDLEIDPVDKKYLIVSCDNRREKSQQGEMWKVNISTNHSQIMKFTEELSFDFHPHGIHIIQHQNHSYLFVINHRTKKDSEIDLFKIKENTLHLVRRFDVPGNPNDIFALSLNEFYYTDFRFFGGSVIKYKDGAYSKLIKHLSLPNGIFIEGDDLYVSTSFTGKLYKYSFLSNKKYRLAFVSGGDNIMPFTEEKLLVCSHPNLFKYIKHGKNSAKKSPSRAFSLNKTTGEKRVIFDDDGQRISALATAFIVNHKLFLGQVFDNFILVGE